MNVAGPGFRNMFLYFCFDAKNPAGLWPAWIKMAFGKTMLVAPLRAVLFAPNSSFAVTSTVTQASDIGRFYGKVDGQAFAPPDRCSSVMPRLAYIFGPSECCVGCVGNEGKFSSFNLLSDVQKISHLISFGCKTIPNPLFRIV